MSSPTPGADYAGAPVAGGKIEFPPKGSTAGVLKKFLDEFVYYRSTYRAELMREWNLAKAYYETIQWVRLDARSDPRRAIRFTQQDPADEIPKPVQNECLPIVDNEIAKLGRRQSKPYVRARITDAAKAGAADRANQVLAHHLERVRWNRKRRRGIYKEVLFGTGIWKSYWKTDYRETIPLGVTGAVKCAGSCVFTLASPEVPETALGRLPPTDPSLLQPKTTIDYDASNFERSTSFEVKGCPLCGGPLEPARLLPSEAQGLDAVGRPLSQDVPMGDAEIEPVSPFDFFPENEGIDVSPEDLQQFGQATPRSLAWVAANFDVEVRSDGYYKDDEKITPDDPIRIAEQHPILGEYAYWSQGPKGSLDRNLYRNHVMVREAYELPTRRYPLGRALVIAGRIVLMDDDLMLPSRHQPGQYFPRVKYCIARFWPRDGEFFAQGIMVPLFSPQNRINMTYSQIVDSRERHGTDAIMLSKGMKLLSPGWTKSFSGRAIVVELDPEMPQQWPQQVQARVMDPRVFQEVDRTREYMQQASGAQDVDLGRAPRNVSAATAIQLLQERAAERRDSREQELRDCFQEVFSHQLTLLSEKVLEKRPYLVPRGKNWEQQEFEGSDLAGLTDVQVEEEASYDLRAFEREGVIQAINLKLYEVDTPFARREAIKAMGLPLSILDETNVQVSDAERKWFDFKQNGVVPPVDPSEDSHLLHWQVYGKFLKSDDGITIKQSTGWFQILPMLTGWEDRLTMAQLADAMARQSISMQQQGIPTQLPVPAEQMLLPQALEQQIYKVWQDMIQSGVQKKIQEGRPPSFPFPLPPPTQSFLAFKAVTEAHRLYAEGKKAQAMVPGQAPLAAPGGGMTPAGTEPVPGQPVSTLGQGAQQPQAPQPAGGGGQE